MPTQKWNAETPASRPKTTNKQKHTQSILVKQSQSKEEEAEAERRGEWNIETKSFENI